MFARNLPVLKIQVTQVELIFLLLIVLQVLKIPRQYQRAYQIFTEWLLLF